MIQDWWENCHKTQSKRYLTGSTLEHYNKFLRIGQQVASAKTILEIGCGMGIATRQLFEMKKDVHVLDISQQGLLNVAHIAKTHHTSNLDKLPKDYFDLAISFLVAQHMNDFDLLAQLKYVLGSLKPTGFLAIQFAEVLDSVRQGYEAEQYGGVSRTIGNFTLLVTSVGGNIFKTVPSIHYTKTNILWHGAYVNRVK